MDEPADKKPEPPKRKRRKSQKRKKPHGNSKSLRPKERVPFKYDTKPVIAKHVGPGRPTGYNPLRGDELVAHMAGGLCFDAAAAMMGFNPDTLYEWARRHPEFAEAKKRGHACLIAYYNRKLNASVDGAAVTAAIFGLKNSSRGSPDAWRDKHEIVTSTAPDDPLLAYLKSIDGKVLRPVEPPTIDGTCEDVSDVTTATLPAQIEGPPRPISPGGA